MNMRVPKRGESPEESAENRDYLAAIMARLGIKGLRFFWTRYVPLDV